MFGRENVDHRGRLVRLASVADLEIALARAVQEKDDEATFVLQTLTTQARDHINNRVSWEQLAAGCGVVILFALALFGSLALLWETRIWSGYVCIGVVLLLLAFVFGSVFFRRVCSRYESQYRFAGATRLLKHGACPACTTGLRREQIAEDGCIACSTCHAAWRAESVGTARVRPVISDIFGYVVDSAGRRQPVLRPSVVVPQEQANEITRFTSADRRSVLISLSFMLAVSIAFVAFVVQPVFTSKSWGSINYWNLAASFVIVAVVGAGFVQVFTGKGTHEPRTIARRLLDRRVCPACGTADIQPDASKPKLLRCAVCDATWHITREVSSGNQG
jgi:cytochrome c biogenesis protein CcdA